MSKIVGKINKISDDPSVVCQDIDVFILGGPSHGNFLF
jgi:hypothetical protein